MRCFASNGYRGTTTREIAAAVGITEAALYRYFPSKQSLYDALIDAKIAGPPIQELAREAVRDRDDRAAFTLVARGLIDRGLGDPDFLRLLFFTALEGHELSHPFFKARVGGLRAFVTDYIRTRIAEGAFRDRDPALCARAFLGMVSDYMNVRVILAQDEAYPQSVDEVVDTFVSLFLAGMRLESTESKEGRPA
jgi:AcrR family transcriptional regulator